MLRRITPHPAATKHTKPFTPVRGFFVARWSSPFGARPEKQSDLHHSYGQMRLPDIVSIINDVLLPFGQWQRSFI